jgi:hypothetical protein
MFSRFMAVPHYTYMVLVGTRDLSYTEMLCVLVMLATSDTGVTSPRPEHHRQAGQN